MGQHREVLRGTHDFLVSVHEEGHDTQGQHLVMVRLTLTKEDAACEGVQNLRERES